MGGVAGGASVMIVIKATDEYSKEFNKATTSLSKFKTAAIGMAVAAGVALAGFAVSAIRSAAESERVANRVRESFGSMADSVLEASKRMQVASTQSDETIGQAFIDLQAKTQSLGLTFQQQSYLIQGSLDLAAKYGKDFSEVVNGISLGLMGNSRGLKQLGIDMKEGATSAEILTAVMERMGQAQGSASRETQTFYGQLANLRNQFGEIMEDIGRELLPVLQDLIKIIIENKDSIISLASAVGDTIKIIMQGVLGIVKVVETLGSVFGYVGTIIANFFDALAGRISWRQFRDSISSNTELLRDQLREIWSGKMALDSYANSTTGLAQAEIIATPTIKATTSEINAQAKAADTAKQKIDALNAAFGKGNYTMSSSGRVTSIGGVRVVGPSTPTGTAIGGGWTVGAYTGTSAAREAAVSVGFQYGGVVSKPTMAMVGEAGPEMITPVGKSGKGMGGVTVNIGNVYGVDSHSLAVELRNELKSCIAY